MGEQLVKLLKAHPEQAIGIVRQILGLVKLMPGTLTSVIGALKLPPDVTAVLVANEAGVIELIEANLVVLEKHPELVSAIVAAVKP